MQTLNRILAVALAGLWSASMAAGPLNHGLPQDDFANFGAQQAKQPPRPTDDCHAGQPSNFKARGGNARLNEWKEEFAGKLGLKRPVDARPTDCDIWIPGPNGQPVDDIGFTYRTWPDGGWHPGDPNFTCTVRIEKKFIDSCSPRKLRFVFAHEMCHCRQLERTGVINEAEADRCAEALTGTTRGAVSPVLHDAMQVGVCPVEAEPTAARAGN